MASQRAVTVIVLLLSPIASSAQPASERTAVPLPVPAATLAAAVGSHNVDRSRVLLDVVRIMFDAPDAPASSSKIRARVNNLLRTVASGAPDTVPLPLTPGIWRDAILQTAVPDAQLIAAILSNRNSALMYYGLSALDDETLGWFASDRDALLHIRKHPGAFAAFGRSVRVHDGRVAVPGGPAAGALWQAVVGGDPANPSQFVRALFRFDRGRAAFLYDTVAHLDAARQQFVLNRNLDALLGVFRDFARDWDAEARPFARPQLDPSLLLITVRVDARGNAAAPAARGLWERVFRDDLNADVPFKEVAAWASTSRDAAVDAAWLARQIHLTSSPVARRRLDTLLFAQRVLGHQPTEPHVIASVLRAFVSMPALMLTLERASVTDASTLLEAARHAQAVNSIGNDSLRHLSITLFQAAIGVIERGTRSQALPPAAARALLDSLVAIPVDRGRGYDDRVAVWIRTELFKAAPRSPAESSDPLEEAVLALLAGAANGRPARAVEWEGVRYRVDPAAAELTRLRRVRQRQAGLSLDAAIAQLLDRRSDARGREEAQRDFRETMASVLYAAHLGDPEGAALAAGNVAVRHDFGFASGRPGVTPMAAWRLPVETFGHADGWRIVGSLLGLDAGLRRLALRRLDSGQLPTGPKLPILERNTAILTVALMNPYALTDDARDRVAAALARGRGRVAALGSAASLAADVAHRAGLSEWRREALRWALVHAPGETERAFSLLELFWLGADASDLDAFGAAPLALTGCLCLEMPDAFAWENLTGRPAAGLLASLGVDVTLRLTEALAQRKLPAVLLPGVLAYAMLDVVDEAEPAYFDDWPAFCRTAAAIDGGRIDDYIAALTADGPLIPASRGTQ